ncbi:thiamine diphosphokinase [Candidatus Viridilinea mediisalina]|uniref:Thiamine diphosphokinase n=1 Tax=Candidatus Viridilinea mediisalina TaxID=2024553 RepID=A0A2A6RLR9_9CHLR|nr:thiamine diphosphokinase [Candidatus Viridilinea mediisalina]PDW03846.1 thiamine diphosphokinase [Candidatus Viridilinea mediisalina]
MHTIIIANAPDFRVAPFASHVAEADLVIAADGGGNALFAAGLTPDLVVGDLDSLDPAARAAFELAEAEIVAFPVEKDETDLELALLAAVARGAERIDILAAFGGRWDQTLANVALLALPELNGRRVRLLSETQEAYLVRGETPIAGALGATISLLPMGGAARGINSRGLRYPLHNAELRFERSRGVSNQISAPPAQISVAEGLLLVVHHFIAP